MKRFLFSLFLLLPTVSHGQSDAALYLVDNYGMLNVQVFSESIIRAVITYADSTNTLEQFGNDLDKIIYFHRGIDDDVREAQKTCNKLMVEGGFELLMEAEYQGMDMQLLVMEDDGVTEAVAAFFESNDQLHFVEIDGELDLAYVMQLFQSMANGDTETNLSSLTNLFNFDF